MLVQSIEDSRTNIKAIKGSLCIKILCKAIAMLQHLHNVRMSLLTK